MLVKMKLCQDMQFQENTVLEITVNSEAIGAFVPVLEYGPTTGKPYIACYQVFFMQGLMYGSPTGFFYMTIEEEERLEKVLKPHGGLKTNLVM